MNRIFEDDKCFLDKLPIGVIITTHEGKILECNTMQYNDIKNVRL